MLDADVSTLTNIVYNLIEDQIANLFQYVHKLCFILFTQLPRSRED